MDSAEGQHSGFMIYGFSKDEAEIVLEYMETLAGGKIIPISGTGMEKFKVMEILNSAPFSDFASADPKIFMFLGFADDKIGAAMKFFPIQERPIFCTPTEKNINWTLEYLIEHLLEEQAALRKK